MPNRLAEETSPYLLQHQNNPVNWHPWGDAALERARREQLPIFLSIGYSACHWCHVMEHESFEDPGIADQLNANFIPIKVDREERPDLDQIYMAAVQMLTGHGGWPMSVFLTPELKPFFGGTYWPPRSGRGMPGFDEILAAVADAWSNRREQALEGAEQLTARLRQLSTSMIEEATAVDQAGSQQLLDGAISQLTHAFDSRDGGFGQAPKFPHPMSLALLLRGWQRKRDDRLLEMVRTTLDRMANGGIYDHLGGGFARYSVDARWLVPHFEKMLYDNALLAGVYLQAFLVTQEPHYAQVVRETLDYLCREMSDPAGGIYSTEDADSEGVEGKFYTWTPADIEQVLGEGAATTFCHVYDVSTDGNFEGTNILHRHKTLAQCAAILNRDEDELAAELASSRKALFDAREQRVRPGRDDKILVAWNGLAIDVLARAGASLDHPEYLEAARQAASFILHDMRREDGRLLHTWRNGTAKLNAYLDDYACLANGLVSLHLASGDEHWIQAADGLMQTVLTRFIDAEGGGFYFTADDHEELITRNKEFTDSSTPSGNGMAATVLFRLGKILGRHDYLAAAQDTVRAAGDFMARAPLATGQLLLVLDDLLGPAPELVLLGDRQTAAMQTACLELSRHYLPRATVLTRDSAAGTNQSQCAELDPAFEGKTAIDGSPTLYVCENFRCQEPAQGLPAIEARLRALAVK